MSNKNLNKKFHAEIDAKTKQYQKIYDFEISSDPKHPTWNNESDAFKHAFMQAILAQRYTIPMSFVAGWFHEIDGTIKGQPVSELNMDLWNNKIGREIFNEVKWELMGKKRKDYPSKRIEDIYAQKIVERMKNGDLITNPNDKRQFKEYDKYFKNKNKDKPTGEAAPVSNIYTREMIGKMSVDEYLLHEPMIMEQLKTQGIPSEKQINKQSNLAGFLNQISGNSNIFTREDIKNMTTDEYLKNEKAIDYQRIFGRAESSECERARNIKQSAEVEGEACNGMQGLR